MVRGERRAPHRGSRERYRYSTRGSDDILPDPFDPEDNFRRGADGEPLPGPVEEEYTWPTIDDDEQD